MLAAAVLVALLAGGGIGYGVGRGSAPGAGAADVVARLRGPVGEIAAGLEPLPGEYRQSGRKARSPTVQEDLRRIAGALVQARGDLAVLAPSGLERLTSRLASVREAVSAGAPASRVALLVQRAKAALAEVPGGR